MSPRSASSASLPWVRIALALAELERASPATAELALGELRLARGRGVALALERGAARLDRRRASSRRSSAASESSSTRSVSRSRL